MATALDVVLLAPVGLALSAYLDPLGAHPCVANRLRRLCKASAALDGDTILWRGLAAAVTGGSARGASGARQSARLTLNAKGTCIAAYRAHKLRGDNCRTLVSSMCFLAGDVLGPLTLAKLRAAFKKFVPYVDAAHSGEATTFLLDVVRARDCHERVIAACARDLLHRGAHADGRPGAAMTPLIVACARNMPGVATALLDAGADVRRRGNGSFRLAMEPGGPGGRKQVTLRGGTARGFVEAIIEAEKERCAVTGRELPSDHHQYATLAATLRRREEALVAARRDAAGASAGARAGAGAGASGAAAAAAADPLPESKAAGAGGAGAAAAAAAALPESVVGGGGAITGADVYDMCR